MNRLMQQIVISGAELQRIHSSTVNDTTPVIIKDSSDFHSHPRITETIYNKRLQEVREKERLDEIQRAKDDAEEERYQAQKKLDVIIRANHIMYVQDFTPIVTY